MAPIRLRHPTGVSTLELDLDNQTVLDLQQVILATTGILPSQQELKLGYPPQSLFLIPELPISSLGLKRGDQLIVTIGTGPAGAKTKEPSIPKPPPSSSRKPPAPAPIPAAPKSSNPKPVVRQETQSRTTSSSNRAPTTTTGADFVETDGGALVHRVVPDDNSCLFSSVAVVFEQDIAAGPRLRQVVADVIRNDLETYNEVFLGRSRDDYIQTILRSSSWGGAIELSIFSEYYQTEISSIDVETGRVDRFGEGKFDNRCILLYSGIHYDAVSLAPTADSPVDFHQTVFPVASKGILKSAGDLATQLRAKRAYTNTSTFDLKCEICGKGLKGEKEARAHASETGHTSFGEY